MGFEGGDWRLPWKCRFQREACPRNGNGKRLCWLPHGEGGGKSHWVRPFRCTSLGRRSLRSIRQRRFPPEAQSAHQENEQRLLAVALGARFAQQGGLWACLFGPEGNWRCGCFHFWLDPPACS